MVSVHRFSPELPLLSSAGWKAFPDVCETERAMYISYAAALENESWIVEARGATGEPQGLAFATVLEKEERRWLAVSFWVDVDKALLFAEGVDRSAVAAELFAGLLGLAQQLRLEKVTMAHTDSTNHPVLDAAAGVGLRLIPAAPTYRIVLSAPTRFEAYREGLKKKYRYLLGRDLRLLEAAFAKGISIRHPERPSPALVEQIWPQFLETLDRKASPARFRGNYFAELASRLPAPEALSIVECMRGETRLGFSLTVRGETQSWCVGSGQQQDAALNVFTALGAWELRAELERGATALHYGPFNDAHKKRLGCTAFCSQIGFFSLQP